MYDLRDLLGELNGQDESHVTRLAIHLAGNPARHQAYKADALFAQLGGNLLLYLLLHLQGLAVQSQGVVFQQAL